MICSHCQMPNRDHARFCKRCGAWVVPHCPFCEAALPDQSIFCDQCGRHLTGQTSLSFLPAIPPPASLNMPPSVPSSVIEEAPARRRDSIDRKQPGPSESGAVAHLERYVPPEFMAKLEAARARGGMIGERRIVTMLFCDLKGSTAAAERLDPEEWAEVMNGAFEYMIGPVYKYEGTVARLMGDAILAFFGAPIAHEDDPQRAILAGLDIVATIRPYRERMQQRWGIDFDVRVGINTGMVVVGAVGSDLRMEYSALGDAINVAARMEQTAQPGTVQIAEDTYRLVAPLFDVEVLDGIEVKGKARPVAAYRVVGRKAEPGRLRGIQGHETPLIGRDSECACLLDAATAVRRGVGQIVFLIGEAGMGKSRLIRELRHHWDRWAEQDSASGAAGVPFARWYETASLSYEIAQPYGLFQRLLRHAMGAAPDEPTATLRDRIRDLVAGIPVPAGINAEQVVESLFGLTGDGSGALLEGESFRGQFFALMEAFWRRRVAGVPTVLVCDDLHWTDPASVALLRHLLPLTEEVPLLFICATRPERHSNAWQLRQWAANTYAPRYTEINVRPLSDADSNRLIDSLLTISDLPASLRARILSRAEGNPFFVEEVVRTLIETGAVRRDAAELHWEAASDGGEIEIPETLNALLVARIDRLAAQTRRTLQLAALIGRSFYYRVLKLIVAAGDGQPLYPPLEKQLDELQAMDLIREAARLPELEYMFRHALTQEAAYETILLKERRDYHRRVGEALENLFPDRREENASALAHHFLEARDEPRALKYLIMAGDAAFRLYALNEAVAHYTEALALAGAAPAPVDQLIHLYTRCGRSYELKNDFESAMRLYEEMESLAAQRADLPMALAALIARATLHVTMTPYHDAEKGPALAQEALTLARRLDDRVAEARSLWLLQLHALYGVMFGQADWEGGLQHLQASEQIARELDLREHLAFTLNDSIWLYLGLGQVVRGIAANEEAGALWRELNNLPMLADNLNARVVLLSLAGRHEEAAAALAEGVRISHAIGNAWNRVSLDINGAMVALARGELGSQILRLETLLMEEAGGHPVFGALSSVYLFLLYAELGAVEQGLRLWERQREMLAQLPFVWGWALAAAARLALLAGDTSEAASMIDAARDAARESFRAWGAAVLTPLVSAACALVTGRFEAAVTEMEEFILSAQQTGVLYVLPEALHTKGLALAALGHTEAAHTAFVDALGFSRAQGERRLRWQIAAGLADLAPEPDVAAGLRAKAREDVMFIADHAGREEFRHLFLGRADVQRLLHPAGRPAGAGLA